MSLTWIVFFRSLPLAPFRDTVPEVASGKLQTKSNPTMIYMAQSPKKTPSSGNDFGIGEKIGVIAGSLAGMILGCVIDHKMDNYLSSLLFPMSVVVCCAVGFFIGRMLRKICVMLGV